MSERVDRDQPQAVLADGEPGAPERAPKKAAKKQIRGSSLLLAGQFLAKGLNFGIQVMIVRHLTQGDYGAFAYALSMAALAETIATFGLDRAVTRFVAIYHEQRDHSRMVGTILMVLGSVLGISLVFIGLFFALAGTLGPALVRDPLALRLLLILVFIGPLDAFDGLLNGLFAVFAKPKAIFVRKYVLGPGFRLAVVVLLLLMDGGVMFLAAGYLMASALVVGIYALVLWHTLRTSGAFPRVDLRAVKIPAGAILAFTVPLLASDLVYVVMNVVDAMLLEYFQDTTQVAALRAVQPTARLNQLVLTSFALLFTPAAARMFARNDQRGINDLYWQNAAWIAVASFPIFALTFSLARPITLLLFGARYEQSALILALLSFGYYFNAATGQNGLTLKVVGRVRYIVVVDVFVALLNLGLNLLLVPRYGALGAAIGTCTSLVIFNVLKQAGLRFGTGVDPLGKGYLRTYLIIGAVTLGLWLIQAVIDMPPPVSVALAAAASVLVFALNRHTLKVGQTFPELLRVPGLRRLIGQPEGPA